MFKASKMFSGNGNSMSGNGNSMSGGSGMMHMGRMVHVESEVNSDLPSSDATSSPGNPGITREHKLD